MKGTVLTAACVLAVLAVSRRVNSEEMGPPLEKCTKDDPNFNECLRKSIQAAVQSLKDGYQPLGMMPLDPMHYQKLGMLCPMGDKCDLIEVDATGMKDAMCNKAEMTMTGSDSFRLTFELSSEHYDASGKYTMEKGYLGNEMSNEGTFMMNFTDFRVEYILDGMMHQGGDGKTYAMLSYVSADLKPAKKLWSHFNNATPIRNGFFNDKPQFLTNSFKKAFDHGQSVMVQKYVNTLFAKVPFDYLLPMTKA